MNPNLQDRLCMSCSRTIKGRKDKKFCDDGCRNNYNYTNKQSENDYVKSITTSLKRNRQILARILSNGKGCIKAKRDILLQMGFTFKYRTHDYTSPKGGIYYYCYDYGYLLIDEDKCLVVRRMERDNVVI